jgi:hypothetical protein
VLEHIDGEVFGEEAEEDGLLFGGHISQEGGDVEGVGVDKELP